MDAKSQAETLKQALRAEIRRRGLSLRALDRLLGRSANFSSQLFRGKPKLRVEHVFEILEALEVAPEIFFNRLYPRPGQTEAEDVRTLSETALHREMLALLRRVGDIAKSLEEKQWPETMDG